MPRRLSPRRTGHSKPRSQSLVSKRRSSFAACRVTHFLTFRAADVKPLQHVARILHSIQMIRCAQAGRLVKAGAEARGRNATKAAQTRRPKLVGLRCRSTRPMITVCRVALSLHLNLQPRLVGLRCRSTRPTTTVISVMRRARGLRRQASRHWVRIPRGSTGRGRNRWG